MVDSSKTYQLLRQYKALFNEVNYITLLCCKICDHCYGNQYKNIVCMSVAHRSRKPYKQSLFNISGFFQGRLYLKISKNSTYKKKRNIHEKNMSYIHDLNSIFDTLHNKKNIRQVLPKLKALYS